MKNWSGLKILLTFVNTITDGTKPTRVHSRYMERLLANWCLELRGCSHIISAGRRGKGVWQMLTIADEGRRGGKPKADNC